MKITKITTYKAPIEGNRLDRYVEDVENKLEQYKLDTYTRSGNSIPYVSWELASPTQGKITIKSFKRPNLIAIESDLYELKKVTYWWLTNVDGIQSAESFTYSCNIASMLTWGEDFLKILEGKNIEIDRMHQDRYIISTNTPDKKEIAISLDNISLLHSDFKIGDTFGQEKYYENARTDIDVESEKIKVYNNERSKQVGVINNEVETGNGKWFKYAIIEPTGNPDTVSFMDLSTGSITHESLRQYISDGKIYRGVGLDRFKMLAPINNNEGGSIDNGDFEFNSMGKFLNMPQGKISSIFLSPFQLTPSYIYYSNKKHDYAGVPISDKEFSSEDELKSSFEDKNNTTILVNNYWYVRGETKITLPTWAGLLTIYKTGSPQELKDFAKELNFEIGLFHPSITSNEFIFKGYDDEPTIIDTYNYLKNPKVEFRAMPDNQGILFDLNISNYHYAVYNAKTQLNVITDSGVNYLNNNRSQIDAQKEGFRLQARLQAKQNQINETSTLAGGGLMGGMMSLINPTNWTSAIFTSQETDINYDIANNNIAKVQAAANDAAAQAPSIREGSGNSWKLAKTFEEVGIFTYRVKRPNKVLLNKIYNHYNKFGYKTEQWIRFFKPCWTSRVKFNFLQIDNLKDYYNGELTYVDESIINDIAKQFKQGIRIWHQSKIEYDNENIETEINNLN